MKRTALLGLLALALTCCTPAAAWERAVSAANDARLVLETAQTSAVALYESQQRAELMALKSQGAARSEAERRLRDIRGRWEPVWGALRAAHEAHAALVDALRAYERGAGTVASVIDAGRALAAAKDAVGAQLRKAREGT